MGGHDFWASSENKPLTARQRWLREHREVRFYLTHDEYKLLEDLASEEGLTVKDFILKLARELRQLKAESSTLRELGVDCKPTMVAECVTELRKILLQRSVAACLEFLEWLLKKRGP
jgi:hypothetical protein